MRSCRICGCTDDQACVTEAGPCHWVGADLCSACDVDDDELAAAPLGGTGFFCDEPCPDRPGPFPLPHQPIYVDGTSGYCVNCRTGFAT